jgi:hypothetical protein
VGELRFGLVRLICEREHRTGATLRRRSRISRWVPVTEVRLGDRHSIRAEAFRSEHHCPRSRVTHRWRRFDSYLGWPIWLGEVFEETRPIDGEARFSSVGTSSTAGCGRFKGCDVWREAR